MPVTSSVDQVRLTLDRLLSSDEQKDSTLISTDVIRGKRVLITGGGGWIGSALARAILTGSPEHLLLLDSSEGNLYEVDAAAQRLRNAIPYAAVLGSVTDVSLLQELFQSCQPQIVFHAAACKHVPLMEDNPFAAVKNNALGTRTLAGVAQQYRTEQFILISTDKAADPCGIMGASKRIAELATLDSGTTGMQTKVLRLVNVIGAQGSVIPRFLQQIAHGGPVTVTHKDAQRYFIALQEAIELILATASSRLGSGLFVPGVAEQIKVLEIAEYLIAAKSSSAEIVFMGLRPGDKLAESLVSVHESLDAPDTLPPIESGLPLLRVNSSAISRTILTATLNDLAQASERRNLEALLRAVHRLVPEYNPAAMIAHHRAHAATAGTPA